MAKRRGSSKDFGKGFYWRIDPEEAFTSGYRRWTAAIEREVQKIVRRYQILIQNWMKENAPWTDRTGNARQSIAAEVDMLVDRIVIAFGIGIDYGIWLETRNKGRYAIIEPALDRFAPMIWAEIKLVLS